MRAPASAPPTPARQGAQLAITVDPGDRYPYKFSGRPVRTTRRALPAGDYAVHNGDRVLAAVERTTLEDVLKSLLLDGKL